MINQVFKAYDIRGVYPDPLSPEVGWRVGYGTGVYLQKQSPRVKNGAVVVGRDMRPHSPVMADALIKGLLASGVDVVELGMVDTSFIYFAINHMDCMGGVQTTASHNPIQYNGYKISGAKATPIGAETGLSDIQALAEQAPLNQQPQAQRTSADLWEPYIAHVRRFMSVQRPLKVAVDASNGMAGAFVPRIFGGVSNLEIIPINFEITGQFTHDPNPLVPENMAQVRNAVLHHEADFGVCFDGDADRCILCDEMGHIIGCDLLGALFAAYFLKQSPGSAIAYDLRSSKALEEAVVAMGGKPVRGRVGHVFMKKLMRDHNAVFGAELSGHMYFRDNYHTDSGAITFATAITIAGRANKPFSELIKPFARYTQSGELNFHTPDKSAVMQLFRDAFPQARVDELDGVSVDCFDREGWWANVRASNTEPLLRLNMEARDCQTLENILHKVTPMLGEPAKGH